MSPRKAIQSKPVRIKGGYALRLILLGLLQLPASGCGLSHWIHNGFKVGPEYCCPPQVAVEETWIEGDPQLIPCPPDYPDWWAAFDDPILNDLIQTAYQQNLSLREAGWRVMQARAQHAIVSANLFPKTQQGFADFERIQESKSVALPAPLRAFDEWSTGFSLSWELDVWGRFRRSIASADAQVEVSVADYDAILLSLIAEVATAYNDYRTFQHRLEYAQSNVYIQEESLKLTQEKADAGKTGYTSVHLAKSNLESTRAIIPALEIGRRQAANRLCTLLGIPTRDLKAELGTGNIPAIPPEVGVAVGIPAELLRRRPDIRAAERAIAAQSEQIGIAVAELYPHFSINGQIALESEEFSQLFTSASTSGAIGPSIRWNLLNYGRVINNVRLQGFGLEELVASYRNTVLTANQEVEDAMVAFLRNQDRVRFLEAAEKETEEALRLLRIAFDDDAVDFTGVFILQGDLVSKQDQLAQARGDVAASLINLYKALGGGWEIRCPGFQPQSLASPQPLPAPRDETRYPDLPEQEESLPLPAVLTHEQADD